MEQNEADFLPRILIIDDLYGRLVSSGVNRDREQLCGRFLLRDVTGDPSGKESRAKVRKPVAEAVFFRGQKPECASVGDCVENDLEGCLRKAREGWNGVQATGKLPWSLVLLDLCFYTGVVTEESNREDPGMSEGRPDDSKASRYFGLTILQALRRELPDLPVVVFSSKPRGDVSYLIDREGARAFLPRDEENGPELLQEFILKYALAPDPNGIVVGRSLPLLKVLRDARMAAISEESTDQNLLILGETGVGKELLARFLHAQSPKRGKGPLIVVNCPQLAPTLAMSELFGIEKRIATGVEKRTGLIEHANNGDLFLDEVADLPADVQPGILRVLDYREVQPHGASRAVKVDVRFISATNEDLEEMSRQGKFRNALLHRLDGVRRFVLPPLRQRPEDIPLLAEHFVRKAAEGLPDTGHRHKLTQEAIEALLAHAWPGNVRELRNIVFRAVSHNPDVEFLHPGHFELPGATSPRPSIGLEVSSDVGGTHTLTKAPESDRLAGLERVLAMAEFEGLDYASLTGFLPRLQEAYAGLLWRYLLVARELSKKPPTPEKPDGEYSYHRLGKLLSGNQGLSATGAKRLLKRILKTDPILEEMAREDAFWNEFL